MEFHSVPYRSWHKYYPLRDEYPRKVMDLDSIRVVSLVSVVWENGMAECFQEFERILEYRSRDGALVTSHNPSRSSKYISEPVKMDCIDLSFLRPIPISARVIDGHEEDYEYEMRSGIMALETRYADLEEENKRLRQILAETPHKRIQYKVLPKVRVFNCCAEKLFESNSCQCA
jgi:hypothetical protein